MGELFTIGHSKHPMDYFISLLNKYKIEYLLDVRSTPYSKYAEQYNKERLSKELHRAGICYSFMGKYFGARPLDRRLYGNGFLDFEKMRGAPDFIKGLENVILGLTKGYRIALMCTEKEPIDCHRAILVARAFELRGIQAQHILPDGSLLSQLELDEQLLQKYFPTRAQLSLFASEEQKSEEEYLAEAYRRRNEEIGYNIEEEQKILAI